MLDTYLKLLDLDFFELTEAFKGLADENVWRRPAPTLLSVGELAGHISYWESLRFTGSGQDSSTIKLESLLIDDRFSYYSNTLPTQPSGEHLAMTAQQVGDELQRVHRESAAYLKELNPDLSAKAPGLSDFWTYEESIKYTVFHVAYHTGQMYSVRHLLGEKTPDN
jgi:hypothetical protein